MKNIFTSFMNEALHKTNNGNWIPILSPEDMCQHDVNVKSRQCPHQDFGDFVVVLPPFHTNCSQFCLYILIFRQKK